MHEQVAKSLVYALAMLAGGCTFTSVCLWGNPVKYNPLGTGHFITDGKGTGQKWESTNKLKSP